MPKDLKTNEQAPMHNLTDFLEAHRRKPVLPLGKRLSNTKSAK